MLPLRGKRRRNARVSLNLVHRAREPGPDNVGKLRLTDVKKMFLQMRDHARDL